MSTRERKPVDVRQTLFGVSVCEPCEQLLTDLPKRHRWRREALPVLWWPYFKRPEPRCGFCGELARVYQPRSRYPVRSENSSEENAR